MTMLQGVNQSKTDGILRSRNNIYIIHDSVLSLNWKNFTQMSIVIAYWWKYYQEN